MAILEFLEAFDTVPHRRLIRNWTSYSVQGLLLTNMDSFLSDRKRTVMVDGHATKESFTVYPKAQFSALYSSWSS